jgi:hypothetical protein
MTHEKNNRNFTEEELKYKELYCSFLEKKISRKEVDELSRELKITQLRKSEISQELFWGAKEEKQQKETPSESSISVQKIIPAESSKQVQQLELEPQEILELILTRNTKKPQNEEYKKEYEEWKMNLVLIIQIWSMKND